MKVSAMQEKNDVNTVCSWENDQKKYKPKTGETNVLTKQLHEILLKHLDPEREGQASP